MKRFLLLGLALLLALAPRVYAQVATGNVYGNVRDESGAVLPGAAVTLSGELGTRTTTTSSQGDFRFLNLDRGQYKVTVALSGFTTVARTVSVVTGENVTLDFPLKVASVAETVTVSGEVPIVDAKKRGTATTLTTEELQNIPSARDPWGVLRNVPGVLLDRVNIAGNENGQQAAVAGKGSTSGDKTWNLDGINVTDMSATGASPTYFDFEAFQEINISTGGGDLNVQTGGIGINLVTKRGTNKFHGAGHYLKADDSWQSGNVPSQIKNDPRLKGSDKADHLKEIADWGFDLGGPIIKDKLWFYGSFGRQDIKNIRLVQTPDDTILDGYNAKVNWQAGGSTMVSGYWFLGNKKKFGRQPSPPVQGEDSFNWDQKNAYTPGGLPGGLFKLQIDHTFSPNFFVSAKGAYYDTGFTLAARGGHDKSYTLDYVNGVGLGSYSDYVAIRPLKLGSLDGSYFFGGAGGNNELKFGFSYRALTTNSQSNYNGNQLVGVINSPTESVAWIVRNGNTNYGGKYAAAYLGDTYTKNRLSLNFGVRWDLQTAKNLASEAPANASFPNVVPAAKYDGNSDNVISWNDISPRVGLAYALDESRKTVVRASFARYASQLSYGEVTRENPIRVGLLAYSWNDANRDRFVQPGEVNLGDFQYNVAIDPKNPGAVASTVNKVDRDYKAKHDNEFIVGIDREIAPNFGVGAAYTYRRATDFGMRPLIGGPCTGDPTLESCNVIAPSQYAAGTPASANGFTVIPYSPNSALVTAGGGGRINTNRDGYFTKFNGLEFTMTKRLSNKWMARAAFSFNDWTEHWDGVTPTTALGSPGRTEIDPLVEGGQVALLSGGSGKASFYSSVKWQLYGNAMVQLPWSVDFAGTVFGKQGGSYPINLRVSGGRDGTLSFLATPSVDTNRYSNVWDADLRLAKNIKLGSQVALSVSAEVFNVFNNNVILSRFRQANSSAFTATAAGAEPGLGRIEEILAPRTLRFGARFSF
jgi:carboxypeptidase family protein/TonB-dependent receptor-like protein